MVNNLTLFVQAIINSTHMSISHIYDWVEANPHFSHEEMYNELIKKYTRSRVNFVLYDLFEYDHLNDSLENIMLEYRPAKKLRYS